MAQLYKKTGSCSRPDGALTDYPMYLVVGESAGSIEVLPSKHMGLEYPPAHSDTYVKATTVWNKYRAPYYATDPGLSLTGDDISVSWRSGTGVITNQRFHIDLGSAKIIRGIYYENYHNAGAWTDLGAKNFIMQGSAESTAFAELTYATDTDWTQIGGSMQFEQHAASNAADPKYIAVTNNTAYRYIALKIADNWGGAGGMGLRRIVLLTNELNVHCDAHCKTNFGDIRFHDAADAALDYWIDWGTLTGTTPNQSVGVCVAPSPGTSDTNVVLKYGDAALTDASDGDAVFLKYKPFESGSDGDSIATADADLTVVSGTCEIDTAQKYAGTRSLKLVGGTTKPDVNIALTAAAGYAIQCRARKTTGADYFHPFMHGNGTKRIQFFCSAAEDIRYYNSGGANTNTFANCAVDTWELFEVRNIDWTAGTYDLYHNGVCILSAGQMNTTADDANIIRVYSGGTSGNDAWIDDLIVRKYASPEPTWGTWGAEEEISAGSDCIITAVTGTLSPSASASPGISATSTTGTLGPSASAGVALSVTALSAILGPVADANLGISIAAASAILGPSASADFDINSEASVLIICQSATLSPSASAGVQISVASQTATLGPTVGIPSIYLILSAEAAVLSPSASAAPAIGITATPAILDPSAGIPGLTLSLSAASAVLDPSASAGAMTVFQYENPVILYYFTLTGAADGETDATIPISSFQARYRDGESTYLSVVIPDYDTYEDIVDARSSGDMVLTMAYSHAGTIYHQEEIMRVDLDTNGIRKDQGGRSQSITLVGHRTMSFSPQTLTLHDVTYRRTGNAGEISYRCANPDIFLRPGDTAVYGSDSFTVGSITYSVSSGYTSMDVTEAKS